MMKEISKAISVGMLTRENFYQLYEFRTIQFLASSVLLKMKKYTNSVLLAGNILLSFRCLQRVTYLFILLLKFNFRLCLKLSALFLVSAAKRMIFWKAKTARPLMNIFVLNIISNFSTVNIDILQLYRGIYSTN